MTNLTQFEVGSPWPYPNVNGMQALITAADDGLSLMLACACDKPTVREHKALNEGPLRFGLLSSPPLTWIILDAGVISYDAPYAVGINSARQHDDILGAAKKTLAITEDLRGLAILAVIDRGKISILRGLSLTMAWWQCLANSILASPQPLDRTSYERAIARDQTAMTTKLMLAKAQIVETGGRL